MSFTKQLNTRLLYKMSSFILSCYVKTFAHPKNVPPFASMLMIFISIPVVGLTVMSIQEVLLAGIGARFNPVSKHEPKYKIITRPS